MVDKSVMEQHPTFYNDLISVPNIWGWSGGGGRWLSHTGPVGSAWPKKNMNDIFENECLEGILVTVSDNDLKTIK